MDSDEFASVVNHSELLQWGVRLGARGAPMRGLNIKNSVFLYSFVFNGGLTIFKVLYTFI